MKTTDRPVAVIDSWGDGSDQRIVQAIIGMAHGLGMLAIAEGVETSEQLQQLTLMGCQEVQGYLFSRPLPAAEFDALVRSKGLLPMTSQA